MFSIWIRMSNANGDENLECYTCGVIKRWQDMDAGHGIAGRNNAVLFLEALVKPQCQQCNRFKHGRLEIFTRKLIEEMGLEIYDGLAIEARRIVQYKSSDYQEIYEKYKEKLTLLGI